MQEGLRGQLLRSNSLSSPHAVACCVVVWRVVVYLDKKHKVAIENERREREEDRIWYEKRISDLKEEIEKLRKRLTE